MTSEVLTFETAMGEKSTYRKSVPQLCILERDPHPPWKMSTLGLMIPKGPSNQDSIVQWKEHGVWGQEAWVPILFCSYDPCCVTSLPNEGAGLSDPYSLFLHEPM